MSNRHANAFPMMSPIEPTEVPPNAHISRVLDMIATETSCQFDKGLVTTLVTQCAEQYVGAPVQDFVPMLMFKEVRDHLRHMEPQRSSG
jgi:hypothetical protein